MKNLIDLRSDTVTKPTPDMWEALKNLDDSQLGDDVYGEDPTVNELEAQAAKLMNKEAALLVTSGTQGNLISLLSQTQPGEEILIEEKSHIFLYEVGSAARIGGLTSKTFSSTKGVPPISQLETMIRIRDDLHQPWTTLLAVENTHNTHGGVVIKPEELTKLFKYTQDHDMKFHMDGARIFNASVALNVSAKELTEDCDSVCFCLSKGLSAPVGSMLCGSTEFIREARKWRKMLGGGMRQAGVIAAAGIVALETMIERLAEDHATARRLAAGLNLIPGIAVSLEKVQTNIVNFELAGKVPVEEFMHKLGAAFVKVGYRGGRRFRGLGFCRSHYLPPIL